MKSVSGEPDCGLPFASKEPDSNTRAGNQTPLEGFFGFTVAELAWSD